MAEKPILFNGQMVRAILEGRKTQTRRMMKPQPELRMGGFWHWKDCQWADGGLGFPKSGIEDHAPYQPGDRLWVKETWNHANRGTDGPYTEGTPVFYREDYRDDPHGYDGEKSPEGKYRNWLPSIHMPRAASRITLEVTDVRAERLEELTPEDCIAEGILKKESNSEDWRQRAVWEFRELWKNLYGMGAWESNPWVWVICFRVLEVKK